MKRLILLNPVKRRHHSRLRRSYSKARVIVSGVRRKSVARRYRVGTRRKITLRTNPVLKKIKMSTRYGSMRKSMSKRTRRRRRSHVHRRKGATVITGVSRRNRHVRALRKRYGVRRRGRLVIRTNPVGNLFSMITSQGVLPAAGGVLGATLISNAIFTTLLKDKTTGLMRFGSATLIGRAGWRLLIPVVAAVVVKKAIKGQTGEAIATGLVLGGVVNSVGTLITGKFPTQSTNATNMYLNEYLGAYNPIAGRPVLAPNSAAPSALQAYLQPLSDGGGFSDKNPWSGR